MSFERGQRRNTTCSINYMFSIELIDEVNTNLRTAVIKFNNEVIFKFDTGAGVTVFPENYKLKKQTKSKYKTS